MIKIIDLRAKFSEEEVFKKFNTEAYAIPNLYLSLLQPFDSGGIKYCIIYLSPDCNFNKLGKTKAYADFYSLFDFNEYFIKNEIERKKMQLLVIHKGMLEIAAEHGWDKKPFEIAYQECLNSDLIFKKQIKKRKLSPNRKFYLSLWAYCDLHYFKIIWDVSDKKGKTIRKGALLKEQPSFIEISYRLNFDWIDDENFLVESNYKGLVTNTWEINLNG